jgi:hypothetical protein
MTRVDYGNAMVCVDCYFAHHYGAHEHEGKWYAGDSDTPCDQEPLGELEGFEVSDNTCSNHYYGQSCATVEDEDADNYGENVEPCEQCGSSDDDNGIEEFSWHSCSGCGSHLGGARYRLHLTKEE